MKRNHIIRSTLNEQAYDRIKEGILKGNFVQGTLYSEQYFADYLNISRTPIRDAILRLKREYYVDIHPNRGIVIKGINEEELNEATQLRIAIDAFCSAYLAEHIHLPQARQMLERLKAVNDMEIAMLAQCPNPKDHSKDVDFIALDLKFHRMIVEYTNNSRLIQLNSDQHSYICLLGVEVVTIDNRKQESVEENQAILNAIESRDEKEAYAMAKQHVIAIQKRLLSLLREKEMIG